MLLLFEPLFCKIDPPGLRLLSLPPAQR